MFKFVFLAGSLILATLVFTPGCSRSPEAKAQSFLDKGKNYYEKRDYGRAILEFRNASRLNQKDAEPYYRIGLAYLAGNDPERAAIAFLKAVEIDPKHAGAQLNIAGILTRSSDKEAIEEAVRRLKTLLDGGSRSPEVLNALALTHLRLGKQDEAEVLLAESLKQFPEFLQTYVNEARARISRRDLPGAERALIAAVDKATDKSGARVALARFYAFAGRSDDAERILRAAVAADANDATALVDLAMVRYHRGDKNQAAALLKSVSDKGDVGQRAAFGFFLMQENRSDEAINEFKRLLAAEPNERNYRSYLLAAYTKVGRLADAEKLLDDAIDKHPKDMDARLERAEVYTLARKYEQAQSDLSWLLQLRPNSAQVHYVLARLHHARGADLTYRQELGQALQYDDSLLVVRIELAKALIAGKGGAAAADILRSAPEAQKSTLEWRIANTWALIASEHMREARQSVDELMAVTRSAELMMQDASVRLATRDLTGARSAAEEALKLSPDNVAALELLARTIAAVDGQGAAQRRVRDYAATRTSNAAMQFFAGNVVQQLGNASSARSFYQAARKADPSFTDAEFALALLDMSEGKYDDARKTLTGLLETKRDDVGVLLNVAYFEGSQKRTAEAIQYYKKVLDIDPANLVALNNLAFMLSNEKKGDEALRYAEHAKEIAPDDPSVTDTLGWTLYRQGLYDAARKHLERAAASSSDPLIQYHLGLALMHSGDPKQAQKLLATALTKAPDAPEAKLAREAIAAEAR